MRHEFLDGDGDPEEIAQDRPQPLGVARVMRQPAGEMQFHVVGHLVAFTHRFHADADQGTDFGREPVGVGPVVIHGRLAGGPGPEEQRRQTMVKQIGERPESRIRVVVQAAIGIFGEMQWQRPVRAEQAEGIGLEQRRSFLAGRRHGGDRAGREEQGRDLADAHGVLSRPGRTAQARMLGSHRLDAAECLKEIELVRLPLDGGEQLYETARRPTIIGHRMTSPRC